MNDPSNGSECVCMTCDEFLLDVDFGNLIDEMYWSGDVVNTEAMFNRMISEATRLGIVLTDVETWLYDKPLFAVYRDTEKGLS